MPSLTPSSTPIAVWVQQAQNGDHTAFSQLMKRYKEGVVSHLQQRLHNRSDAEDVAMQAFTNAFEKIATYSPQYQFSTWIYKIANNCCTDFERKHKDQLISIDNLSDKDTYNAQHTDKNPEETIIAAQDIALTKLLLAKLSPTYRQVIELRYLHEFAYEEIAKKLNLPIGTVKTRLSRGKDLLVKMLINNKL
ncbi:DNA-directed RNA polymerase sigma-70 factor [Bacteroidia bacterium]|nr:DNA-directed RNA polymerase sigma-70 factor [Bacteroidia bacterium]